MYLGSAERDAPVNAHRYLTERNMPFVAYPPPNSSEVLRYVPRVDTTRAFARGDHNVAFVGQIPRLLPLPYVPWAVDLLAEEYVSKWVLQTQPNGCAKVWVETEGHGHLLVERNKRLMFDVCGVFVARSPEEIRIMEDYQQALQVAGPIDARVPRNGVLLERLRPPQAPKSNPQPNVPPPTNVAYGAPLHHAHHHGAFVPAGFVMPTAFMGQPAPANFAPPGHVGVIYGAPAAM